jgi:hypothetical protein
MEDSKMLEDGDVDSCCPEADSVKHFTSNNAFPANDAFDDFRRLSAQGDKFRSFPATPRQKQDSDLIEEELKTGR